MSRLFTKRLLNFSLAYLSFYVTMFATISFPVCPPTCWLNLDQFHMILRWWNLGQNYTNVIIPWILFTCKEHVCQVMLMLRISPSTRERENHVVLVFPEFLSHLCFGQSAVWLLSLCTPFLLTNSVILHRSSSIAYCVTCSRLQCGLASCWAMSPSAQVHSGILWDLEKKKTITQSTGVKATISSQYI